MRISSCNSCGVVLDKDKLPFIMDVYSAVDGSVDLSRAQWCAACDDYTPTVPCPVCGNPVAYRECST